MNKGGHLEPLLLLALFHQRTPSCFKVRGWVGWVVAHVILVSAKVLLVLTLGLWTWTWAWQKSQVSVPSHNLLNGRTCHRENTEMPPQLTFCQTRDEAQKSEQQQPQGAVKKLGVIFSQFAVHANNTMWCGRKKGVEPAPSVGGCWHIDNCLGLSSPLLSAQCISHTGALASGQSESGHHTVNTWGVKLRREEFSTRGDLCQWQQVTLSYMGEKIK